MNYKEVIRITKEQAKEYNDLLEVDGEDGKVYEMGYPEDCCLYRLTAYFKNGYFADIQICSGTENFFCDPVLFNENGMEMCVIDCADTVDGEYIFEDDDDTYTVIVEVA